MMSNSHFTISFLTDQTPQQLFHAILQVRQWWSGYYSEQFEGESNRLDDVFSFRAGDGAHYSRQQLTEFIPNRKVVWLVTESYLSFMEKRDEWTGTKLRFDISEEGGKTKLSFTHEGLTPVLTCYSSCAPAWTNYLQNKLFPLISSNKNV